MIRPSHDKKINLQEFIKGTPNSYKLDEGKLLDKYGDLSDKYLNSWSFSCFLDSWVFSYFGQRTKHVQSLIKSINNHNLDSDYFASKEQLEDLLYERLISYQLINRNLKPEDVKQLFVQDIIGKKAESPYSDGSSEVKAEKIKARAEWNEFVEAATGQDSDVFACNLNRSCKYVVNDEKLFSACIKDSLNKYTDGYAYDIQ